ncbi:phosphate ABC transporter substrate-binding protein PstS [Dactylosporangium sp. CA-139066]|uniref:phosphate ABC transporter substrate-binding protein PstS n=1 Tax=Dactylosporangium sp. CA-139066 TaxID=3239930 RepID=UPI003D928CC0
MSRKALAALGAGLTLTLLTAGCGSTSKVDDSSTTGGPAQVAFGDQICGKGTGDKPGYTNTIAALPGGADKLSGAGSTFVAPIMSVWTKEYATAGKVEVAYQSIGSGGGINQINAATVDFGASDAPMKDDELAKAKNGPILHIPLTLGAVVPAYNVKGLPAGLKFDGETLGKIFAGKITKWNDPALKALNTGIDLPDEPIAVAHRSDGSGTTAVWTDYLTKESPTWVSTLGDGKSAGKEVAWPTGIGGKGNEGVSGVVNQTEGAIGYVELAYALAQNLKYGQVKNKAGKFIQPCVATISKGTDGVKYPADLRTSLTDGPDGDAFPITGTVYALVYQNQTDKAKAAALLNFLAWTLTTGQDMAASVNYAPLGKDLQQLSYSQLKKITINGTPAVS